MYRVISPTKIVAQRGGKTRRAVIERIDKRLTEQELFAYEKGIYRPSEKKLGLLLQALDCSFEDISEPKELIAA